jgi:hypothetical protein
MKRILQALLLISPFSFADWGDVYYCVTTHKSLNKYQDNLLNLETMKFSFKLDQEKNTVIFPLKSPFGDLNVDALSGELFDARNKNSIVRFRKGKLYWTRLDSDSVSVVSADCDKF